DVVATDDIVLPTIPLLAVDGDTPRQFVVDDRGVDHQVVVGAAVVADGTADAGGADELRIFGIDLHGATCGIASEQGALWPAQHFHPFDIRQVDIGAHRPGPDDIVHIGADGCVQGADDVVLGLAANGGSQGGVVAHGFGVHHIGNVEGDIDDLGRPLKFECVATHAGDGDGHV